MLVEGNQPLASDAIYLGEHPHGRADLSRILFASRRINGRP
jgi:hypothetical protein